MAAERMTALLRRGYAAFLELYPQEYRHRFADSMLQTFDDLCREHKDFAFAIGIFIDTFISIFKENLMSNQLTTKLAVLGLILMIPFASVFGVAMIWQLLNWIGVAGSPDPVALIPNVQLAFWLVFLAPALAGLLNAGALTYGAVRVGPRAAMTAQFAKSNALTLVVVVLGAGVTVFIFGHDAIPCFLKGLLNGGGWGNIGPLFQLCMKA
jgi:hypothetical protein